MRGAVTKPVGWAVAVWALALAAGAAAQGGGASCAPQWSTDFARPEVNGTVRAQAIYDDGTGPALYVGGDFTQIGGISANYLAKWNGATWSTVGGGTAGPVYALEPFTFGGATQLYVGGQFSSVGTGTSASHIARWNGTTWSAVGSGVTAGTRVNALAVHNAGAGNALYVGGEFNSAGGVANTAYCARYTGALWQSVGGGFTNGQVWDLHVHTSTLGTHLYACGEFANSGATAVSRIARFTGTAWTGVSGGFNGYANAMASHNDGSGAALYVAGTFSTAGPASLTVGGLARWDGAAWSPVGNGLQWANNIGIRSMRTFDDGTGPKLWAAGYYSSPASPNVPLYVARWDGLSWTDVSAGIVQHSYALTVFSGPQGAQLWAGAHRWTGQSWQLPGLGANNPVNSFATVDLGAGPRILLGGAFSTVGGIVAPSLAAFDGATWASVATPGTGGGTANAAIVGDIGDGPRAFFGGDLSYANVFSGVFVSDGTTLTPLPGIASVYALAIFDDGTGPALYAGGQFQLGPNGSRVAKWNGTAWQPVGGGLAGGIVSALHVHDDGSGAKLYAGGGFSSGGTGVGLSGLARWDGSTWSSVGPALSGGTVNALASYAASGAPRLVVGGNFTYTGAVPRPALAQWDGVAYSTLGAAPASTSFTAANVFALKVHDDGSGPALYVGGHFASVGAATNPHLAKWNGATWSNVGGAVGSASPGGYAEVRALGSFESSDGPALYAGGNFATVGGVPSSYIAKWYRPGAALYAPTTAQLGDPILYELATPAPWTPYVFDVSFSGSSPGVPVAPGVSIPLNRPWVNVDYGFLTAPWLSNFIGFTDATGAATATVAFPPFPFLAGLPLSASFLTLDPFSPLGIGGVACPRTTTFVAADPAVVSVTPPFGGAGGGHAVVVHGAGFRPGAVVRFDGALATGVVVAADGASISCVTPSGVVGPAGVRVENADGTWTQADGAFAYTTPLAIASVAPGAAPAGTTTVVAGAGFQPGATVTCGGVPATDVVVDALSTPNTLTFTRPAGVPCGASLTATLPDGQAATVAYDVVPTVSALFLAGGPASGGGQFFVVGTDFAPGTTVTVGGAPAPIVQATSTAILCTAPPGTVGNANVVVLSPSGCAASTVGIYVYN